MLTIAITIIMCPMKQKAINTMNSEIMLQDQRIND